ncbi:HAD family phosphatase [Clostridiales bacterium COT073_COT-073]|nr:HAD family phosphatase [Clostridiales bacterium COT073_COT-073]
MYRLIAIDLDDTLLADDLSIHPENVRTLRLAKEKGVQVVLCSGRESASMLRIMKELPFLEENDYYISYNGAMVQTVSGEILWQDKITEKSLKKMIELGRKHELIVQCYSDGLVVDTDDDRITKYEKNTGIGSRRIDDLMNLQYSIKVLFNSEDKVKLENLKAELEQTFGEEYHYFYSKPEYLEVLYKTSNKGLAVKFLAEYLSIPAEQVICIGDSFNDSYMIEYAGLGVAMKNANWQVQKIADVVTENTNNEGGVAEIVEKYILGS